MEGVNQNKERLGSDLDSITVVQMYPMIYLCKGLPMERD